MIIIIIVDLTLLDLVNAFGEVHHNLIPTIPSYHVIPSHVQSLIISLYKDFRTSIIKDQFHAPTFSVHLGLLQGDRLRPLIFNFCFNIFIQYLNAE